MVRRNLEGGFKRRFVLAESNVVALSPSADKQGDGIDQERLAGPRFPGENGKTCVDSQTEVLNNRKIGDAQLGEHRFGVGF